MSEIAYRDKVLAFNERFYILTELSEHKRQVNKFCRIYRKAVLQPTHLILRNDQRQITAQQRSYFTEGHISLPLQLSHRAPCLNRAVSGITQAVNIFHIQDTKRLWGELLDAPAELFFHHKAIKHHDIGRLFRQPAIKSR